MPGKSLYERLGGALAIAATDALIIDRDFQPAGVTGSGLSGSGS